MDGRTVAESVMIVDAGAVIACRHYLSCFFVGMLFTIIRYVPKLLPVILSQQDFYVVKSYAN